MLWRDSFSDYSQDEQIHSYFTSYLWPVDWDRSGVFCAWLHWLPWRDLKGWKLMSVLHPLTAGKHLIIKSVSSRSTLDLISCFRWRKFFSWLLLVSSTKGGWLQNLSFCGFISKKLPLNPRFQSFLPACTVHKWSQSGLLPSFCGSRGWPPH